MATNSDRYNAAKIHIKKSHQGALHRQLGVPQGSPIPDTALQKAADSPDPTTRKRAQFAINAKGWNH